MKTDKAETSIEKVESTVPEIAPTDVSGILGDMPLKSDENGSVVDLLGDHLEEPEKKKRGRPAGSTSKKRTATQTKSSAKHSAETVVTIQDRINEIVSNGEHITDPETRKTYTTLWQNWFIDNPSAEPPAWLVLALATISYSAPAFASESAKGVFGKLWLKAKGWIAKKRGLVA